MTQKTPAGKSSADLITAFIFFIAGISIRHFGEQLLRYAYYINIIALLLGTIKGTVFFILKRKVISIFEGAVNMALLLILIFMPASMIFIFKVVCSGYFILLCVIHIIAFMQLYTDTKEIKSGLLIMCAFEIRFAYLLFFNSEYSLPFLGKTLGLHLMVYSMATVLDILISKIASTDRKRSKIHIPLPNILSAMIPKRILTKINKAFRSEDIPENMINLKKQDDHQLEVFIHMADTLFGQVGHVDMCYAGHVISYGSYDESSYKLNGMIGDGVVEIVDRAKYIRFCLEVANKHIVSFGIRLTENEELRLQKKLFDIYDNLTEWYPPITLHDGSIIRTAQYELDYASSLYEKTNAKFYKFKDGHYSKFKTYFGLFTNCATLVREITAQVDINLFDFWGILSPGTFYDYLNSEYGRENSFVVAKNLYATAENVKAGKL
ncbi:MAG: hypothetical protein IKM61_06560 [Eubacteriaceae bacterium]|nr:hypothetical protein [Eubacteriaceae bacterium]